MRTWRGLWGRGRGRPWTAGAAEGDTPRILVAQSRRRGAVPGPAESSPTRWAVARPQLRPKQTRERVPVPRASSRVAWLGGGRAQALSTLPSPLGCARDRGAGRANSAWGRSDESGRPARTSRWRFPPRLLAPASAGVARKRAPGGAARISPSDPRIAWASRAPNPPSLSVPAGGGVWTPLPGAAPPTPHFVGIPGTSRKTLWATRDSPQPTHKLVSASSAQATSTALPGDPRIARSNPPPAWRPPAPAATPLVRISAPTPPRPFQVRPRGRQEASGIIGPRILRAGRGEDGRAPATLPSIVPSPAQRRHDQLLKAPDSRSSCRCLRTR